MADTDLVFSQAPIGQPANLVFGDADVIADQNVSLAATLPNLTVDAFVGEPVEVTLDATLPGMTVAVSATLVSPVFISASVVSETETLSVNSAPVTVSGEAVSVTTERHLAGATLPGLTVVASVQYLSETSRPLVGKVSSDWQTAVPLADGSQVTHQGSAPAPAGTENTWSSASKTQTGVEPAHRDAIRLKSSVAPAHQEAVHTRTPVQAAYANMLRGIRPAMTGAYQEATRLGLIRRTDWQDRIRSPRPSVRSTWDDAQKLLNKVAENYATALPSRKGWASQYQEAIVPPAGISAVSIPSVSPPCYTPPAGSAVHLLFKDPWSSDTALLFTCGQPIAPPTGSTVVVPIQRVYMVLNHATLKRVDGNIALPTFSMAMSLDFDSWTWSFSAALPGEALADLQPSAPGEPVLVEATVNGVAYRMQIERRSRDRSFGASAIRISGRGLSATLDAPYAPILSHSNDTTLTAQQIMNQILTLNGVSLGWTVDWQAVDWSVPAGLFAHQGSYISALNVIAAAAGSYIQPHRIDQVLHVLPKYPVAPWDWASVTPDFEIPASVATVEGIEFIERAQYNRVFVSGTRNGVLGQVTRAGTDGGLVAPMVTDSLITSAAAARQRGIPVLADTGSQATVSLRMPVLESTGIIPPGKFVRYVDGGVTRLGITRSVSVDINSPETWQTIALETHV